MLDFFDTFVRIVVALLLGGIIGLEREKRGRSVGFRTHILVCVGSALIMLVSLYMHDAYAGNTTIDPSRIAAGVVTGIGFLGAGTIIRSSEHIVGLTSAASVWVSAAIGLAVGCGYFSGAFISTAIAYFTLSPLKAIEKKVNKRR